MSSKMDINFIDVNNQEPPDDSSEEESEDTAVDPLSFDTVKSEPPDGAKGDQPEHELVAVKVEQIECEVDIAETGTTDDDDEQSDCDNESARESINSLDSESDQNSKIEEVVVKSEVEEIDEPPDNMVKSEVEVKDEPPNNVRICIGEQQSQPDLGSQSGLISNELQQTKPKPSSTACMNLATEGQLFLLTPFSNSSTSRPTLLLLKPCAKPSGPSGNPASYIMKFPPGLNPCVVKTPTAPSILTTNSVPAASTIITKTNISSGPTNNFKATVTTSSETNSDFHYTPNLMLKNDKYCTESNEYEKTSAKTDCGNTLQQQHTEKPKAKHHDSKMSTLVTCKICRNVVASGYAFKKHMAKHAVCGVQKLKPEKATCNVCNKVVCSVRYLKQHMVIHTGSNEHLKNFNCEICGKGFVKKENFSKHMKRHSNPKRRYECKQCDASYSTNQSLQIHVTAKHSGHALKYKCDLCEKEYISLSGLSAHKFINHKARPTFPCHLCGKVLKMQSYLKLHMLNHKNERNYTCKVCSKTLISKSRLTEHMKLHYTEHKCDVCHKVLSTRSSLRIHQRIHTGEKRYMCEVCGRTFTQSAPLKTHMKVHKR